MTNKIIESSKSKKFIFNLPYIMKEYLEWKAAKTGEHQATIVRDSIRKFLKKDKINYDKENRAQRNHA